MSTTYDAEGRPCGSDGRPLHGKFLDQWVKARAREQAEDDQAVARICQRLGCDEDTLRKVVSSEFAADLRALGQVVAMLAPRVVPVPAEDGSVGALAVLAGWDGRRAVLRVLRLAGYGRCDCTTQVRARAADLARARKAAAAQPDLAQLRAAVERADLADREARERAAQCSHHSAMARLDLDDAWAVPVPVQVSRRDDPAWWTKRELEVQSERPTWLEARTGRILQPTGQPATVTLDSNWEDN